MRYYHHFVQIIINERPAVSRDRREIFFTKKKFNSKGKPVKSTITVIITEERLPFLSWTTVHDLDSHGYPSADFYNQMNYKNTWSGLQCQAVTALYM